MQHALTSFNLPFAGNAKSKLNVTTLLVIAAALMLTIFAAHAANNNGAALQAAFTQLDDMVNGYGKQLLTVVGFAVALIGYMAANATSIVMKFVGFCIFAGVGLGAAVTVVGAVI
jgi:type IV secretory pathway VirB2 component (pilin)